MDYIVKFNFTEWSKKKKGLAMAKSGEVDIKTDLTLEQLKANPPELLNFIADEMEKLVKGLVPAGMVQVTEIKETDEHSK